MSLSDLLRVLSAISLLASLHPVARAQADLSPAHWPEGELTRYSGDSPPADAPHSGMNGVVAGTGSLLSVRAGLEALHQGGSAMDAALTTALTHVCLDAGCVISYAGILRAVYYEADTGQVFVLDAGYNTVAGESDPLTIPSHSFDDLSTKPDPVPKGRTVLVPGFMAGVAVAHERFGQLPWAQVFEPACYFAEQGVPLSRRLAGMIQMRREILARRPETRAVFTKDGGGFHQAGDTFRQPALAATLRAVAEQGVAFLYQGAWAEALVEAVQDDGGHMTLEDLARYEARWDEPLRVPYGDHEVFLAPGAAETAGMLYLCELAEIRERGHYTQSPEAFYWLARIMPAVKKRVGLEALDLSDSDWAVRETAELAWQAMQDPAPRPSPVPDASPHHSAAVVAVDRNGNVAALLHSINTAVYGENGLNVGGISIPDSATFQQELIAATGPGKRLENPTLPLLVTKDGKPVLAMSSVGSGLQEETLKCLLDVLDHGKDPQAALAAPSLLPTSGLGPDSAPDAACIFEGSFSEKLLAAVRALGLTVEELPAAQARSRRGNVVIAGIDAETGLRTGATIRRYVLGH